MNHILPGLALFFLLLALAGCRPGAPAAGGSLTIINNENAQVELIDAEGRRVLIDVIRPDKLSREPSESDVLLVTHTHPDHLNKLFVQDFPGQSLVAQAGRLELPGVKVRGIASAHGGSTGSAVPEDIDGEGSNYLFVVEIGGLRVAHLGDLGQEAFTEAQLEALGKVDVAIMQLSNSYSAMDAENRKGFNLLDQLKPALIIPTHTSEEADQIAVEKWPAAYQAGPLALTRAGLPKETTIVYMGAYPEATGKRLNLSAFQD